MRGEERRRRERARYYVIVMLRCGAFRCDVAIRYIDALPRRYVTSSQRHMLSAIDAATMLIAIRHSI